MNVVPISRARPGNTSCLPADLRKLADAIERGEVDAAIVAYYSGESVAYLWGSDSVLVDLSLATLAHQRAVQRLRE